MLGRSPISTLPIAAQEFVLYGDQHGFAVRDRSGPLFVVVDKSASYLKGGRE